MTEATVEVHLFAAARAAVGASVLVVPAGTLAGLLDALADEYPGFAPVRPRCSYLVDGTSVHGDLAAIAVASGSRVDVLPPFAGG
jgi:molybdopterin converting factor small subunit